MNTTTAVIGTGVAGLAAAVVCSVFSYFSTKGRNMNAADIKAEIDASAPDSEKEFFNLLARAKKLKEDHATKSIAYVNKGVDQYKSDTGYTEKRCEIISDKDRKIKAYRDSINYDESKARIKSVLEESKRNYRTDLNYDSKMEEYKANIEEAKASCKRNLKYSENNITGLDDESMKGIKDKIEAHRDAIVKENKQHISELEDSFKKKCSEAEKEANDSIRELDSALNGYSSSVNKECSEKIAALDKDVEIKHQSLQDEYNASVSLEDREEMSKVDYYKSECELIKASRESAIKDKLSAIPMSENVARYCKEKNIGKFGFMSIAAIPVLAIIFPMCSYISFIASVLERMA